MLKALLIDLARRTRKASRRWMDPLVISDFNRLYHSGYYAEGSELLYDTTTWMGVRAQKCPTDIWIYQEILHETRPDVIVETGVNFGGATLLLANLCDLLGHGEVVAVDITLDRVHENTRKHPRVTLLEGSSTAPDIVEQIAKKCAGKRTMVTLDSDHSADHVYRELSQYSPLVSPGLYLICEDTNTDLGAAARGEWRGPSAALQRFLSENDQFTVDLSRNRMMLTFNPKGYLRRNLPA
jgi:cephalosporin hydroxylase